MAELFGLVRVAWLVGAVLCGLGVCGVVVGRLCACRLRVGCGCGCVVLVVRLWVLGLSAKVLEGGLCAGVYVRFVPLSR